MQLDQHSQESGSRPVFSSRDLRYINWVQWKSVGYHFINSSWWEWHRLSVDSRRSTLATPAATNTSQHVLIIGGGIGGLCLAQGLKKHGIPFTVFEHDPSPDYRSQGYRLRINGDGYAALEATLTPEMLEVFLQSNAAFEPGFVFHDAVTGERAMDKAPPIAPRGAHQQQQSTAVPRAFASDRATLCAVLAARLTPNELCFGMRFKAYTLLLDDQGVQVEFDNGEIVQGTLLVGVDGTHSRVRKQYLPEHRRLDTDGRAVFGKTLLTPEFEAVFPKDALAKTALVTHPEPLMSLFSEPMRFTRPSTSTDAQLPDVDDYLYWVLIARANVFGSNVEALTPEQLKQLSFCVTEHWSPKLRLAFERQVLGAGVFIKISAMHPTIKEWAPTRVALLGDAIHAMTPAGIGANTALQDAHVLLECLLSKGVGVAVVSEYEACMRVYASTAIVMSLGAGQKMFGQPPLEEMKAI